MTLQQNELQQSKNQNEKSGQSTNSLPLDSIDSIVTFQKLNWNKVFSVLKPGAHLICLVHPLEHARNTCAIEDAGFEIRDAIQFLCVEPLIGCLARKPLDEKTVASNCLKWGTGGINVDGCRIENIGKDTTSRPNCVNKKYGQTLNCYGNRNEKGGPMLNSQGRWPANLILGCYCQDSTKHDPECAVRRLDEQSGTLKSGSFRHGLITKPTNGVSKGKEKARLREAREGDSGTASRFFKTVHSTKELAEYLQILISPPKTLTNQRNLIYS